jgi:hypothetical protein
VFQQLSSAMLSLRLPTATCFFLAGVLRNTPRLQSEHTAASIIFVSKKNQDLKMFPADKTMQGSLSSADSGLLSENGASPRCT